MKKFQIAILCSLLLGSCGHGNKSGSQNGNSVKPADAQVISAAKDAYYFGLPLVIMDITRLKASDVGVDPLAASVNSYRHLSNFPDANFRSVVRPNADTYYSTAFLNLAKEPVVLSVPDTKDRYYMMPMLDAYTNVFASPGKRTTGTKAGNFLISGPGWTGTVPADMKQIKAPTNMVWIIGRTQVNSKDDGSKIVVPLQQQYQLIPLSAFGKPYIAPLVKPGRPVPKGDPNAIVKAMPIDSFFNSLNQLMEENPPFATDKAILDEIAKIGVKPGGKFDLSSFDSATQAELKEIPQEVNNEIIQGMTKPANLVNGWKPVDTAIGSYGTDYNKRAIISLFGLGANLPQDAVYPSCGVDNEGNNLNGVNKYVLHFSKGQTPPANAFWSLTMYDNEGYMVRNPINRNAIGDRSGLKTNADGSTDIYIQTTSPGKANESNWLPSPPGDFNILMRIYWPKDDAFNGKWTPPPVKKI